MTSAYDPSWVPNPSRALPPRASYFYAHQAAQKSSALSDGSWHWKSLPRGTRIPPEDALSPACEVMLAISASSPADELLHDVLLSVPPYPIEWFYVVEYQATISVPSKGLFPESDELRGTPNDYESEDQQIQDVHSYNRLNPKAIFACSMIFLLLLSQCAPLLEGLP